MQRQRLLQFILNLNRRRDMSGDKLLMSTPGRLICVISSTADFFKCETLHTYLQILALAILIMVNTHSEERVSSNLTHPLLNDLNWQTSHQKIKVWAPWDQLERHSTVQQDGSNQEDVMTYKVPGPGCRSEPWTSCRSGIATWPSYSLLDNISYI